MANSLANFPIRRILVTILLLIVLGIAGAVIAIPTLKSDKPGIVAAIAMIAALVLGGRALWSRPSWWFMPVALAALAAIPFVVVARGFREVDMLAILFHVEFGIQGADLSSVDNEIIQAVSAALLLILAGYLLSVTWSIGAIGHILAAAILIVANPGARFGFNTMLVPTVESDLSDLLVDPRMRTDISAPPDIVIVYLEGLDRHYADSSIYGNSYAPIAELEREALSFTNVGQIAGTGWSLAGFVASQCGVPLMPKGFRYVNNFETVDAFLPSVTCLGDVLKSYGYFSAYFVGGELGFAGFDIFNETHQISEQVGLDELPDIFGAEVVEAATPTWVADDQLVFDAALRRHSEILEADAPYLIIAETTGPHGKQGFLSRRCTSSGRSEISYDVARVVRCTGDEALRFVREIQRRQAEFRADRELRVIVLSDHLSHNRYRPPAAKELTDRNTVLFLGGAGAGEVNNRAGAMIDVFPTMLEWLGFAESPVAAGLGRSLLGAPRTLVEDRGIALIDQMVRGDARLSREIWSE